MADKQIGGKPESDWEKLSKEIQGSLGSDKAVSTILKTNEQVIARVTDGIYRQPASALRELISNAYDADATRVVIKTDVPRFGIITVEDDGNGMTPDMVAYLVDNIGGSAKRTHKGERLSVTKADDPLKSPCGRRLIGKIGIGLFSVSQLTHTFQIITKTKGDSFRTIASVVLKQYSENGARVATGDNDEFESGKVSIWREKASDKEAHGTSIVLTGIRPQARDTLRSRGLWDAIEQSEKGVGDEDFLIRPPKYHVGRVDPSSGELLKPDADGRTSCLPWEDNASPENAFRQFVDRIWGELDESNAKPRLEGICDYYLRMVWQLALAVPLNYVDGHLFDKNLTGSAYLFELSNSPKGQPTEQDVPDGSTIRRVFDLKEPDDSSPFTVYVDDLKLMRPVKFTGLPTSNHALKKPIVFIGKCKEEFKGAAKELSGGPMSFEAYLIWNPKIAPTEHQGSLIRIHGSSGTLFDPSFMRYQIAELTRLTQTTCEIFVNEGLDSALNIDRESFNYAHPHSVFITRWLHGALRQLATAQKKLAGEVRSQDRKQRTEGTLGKIQEVVEEVWQAKTHDPGTIPPTVELVEKGQKKQTQGGYSYQRDVVTPKWSGAKTDKGKAREAALEAKLKAIAQVLAAFGLLDILAEGQQDVLLGAIHKILDITEE